MKKEAKKETEVTKSKEDQFVTWLDPYVIAQAVKEELDEAGEKPTLEAMQNTWLSCLCSINSFIRDHIAEN